MWAHAGFEPAPFRSAKLCAELMERHPNLYMSIRLSRTSNKPSGALQEDSTLKPDWRQFFVAYADRLVIGTDSMYGSTVAEVMDEQFVLIQKALRQLPEPVANKIAHENARRIYRLGQ